MAHYNEDMTLWSHRVSIVSQRDCVSEACYNRGSPNYFSIGSFYIGDNSRPLIDKYKLKATGEILTYLCERITNVSNVDRTFDMYKIKTVFRFIEKPFQEFEDNEVSFVLPWEWADVSRNRRILGLLELYSQDYDKLLQKINDGSYR